MHEEKVHAGGGGCFFQDDWVETWDKPIFEEMVNLEAEPDSSLVCIDVSWCLALLPICIPVPPFSPSPLCHTNPWRRLMREMETQKHQLQVERNLCKLALLQVRLEVFPSVFPSVFNRPLESGC